MGEKKSAPWGYALAGVLGGVLGGLLVVLALRAMPRMMAGRMREMMAMMKERGVNMPET
jgi:hypothetical protein